MTITPEMLAAYADGELSADEVARVEAAMAADPALADEVAAHRALRAQLSAHFAPLLDRPVPEAMLAALRTEPESDNIVDFGAARRAKQTTATPARARWLWSGALAASLALGLVLGTQLPRGGGPIVREDGRLIASGALDKALSTQLASAGQDQPVRVLLSFRRGDGQYCRGFEDGATAGIACRAGDRWAIERTQAEQGGSTTAGGYRQAGSAAGAIMAAAQDMAPDGALDAEAERRARDTGWRK
jgi:hypothetical protein